MGDVVSRLLQVPLRINKTWTSLQNLKIKLKRDAKSLMRENNIDSRKKIQFFF